MLIPSIYLFYLQYELSTWLKNSFFFFSTMYPSNSIKREKKIELVFLEIFTSIAPSGWEKKMESKFRWE